MYLLILSIEFFCLYFMIASQNKIIIVDNFLIFAGASATVGRRLEHMAKWLCKGVVLHDNVNV